MSIFSDFIQDKAKKKGVSPQEWIENILTKADSLCWATHVAKFTHTKASLTWYDQRRGSSAGEDGYLSTASTNVPLDISAGAAALPPASLLLLELEDGRTVYEHALDGSPALRKEVEAAGVSFREFVDKASSLQKAPSSCDSDERLRQVYFPVGDDNYHLLTVLPPSGVAVALENALRDLRATKDDGTPRAEVYDTIPLYVGGTQPQNVSMQNSKLVGKITLLPSMPPVMEVREVRRPKWSFFRETLRQRSFEMSFRALHKLYRLDKTNMRIHGRRVNAVERIVDRIILRASALRKVRPNWSDDTRLSLAQKIWLDSAYEKERSCNKAWMDEVAREIVRWLVESYERRLGEDKVSFGESDLLLFRKLARQTLELVEEEL